MQKKDGNVIVKYVDEEGNELASSETINGKVGDAYTTEAKTIYGYEIKVTPENANGNMTAGTTEVTYVYAKKDSTVVVKYVDKLGNEISTSDTINGKVGDDYVTSRKDIEGYKSIGIDPSNKVGVMTEETITVTYIYEKETGTVTVKYVDRTGAEIATSDTINGNVGDTYTTSAKSVYGYKLEVTPENANGSITAGNTEVIYVYSKVPGSVVVKYVDTEGNEIATAERIDGEVGDVYTTTAKDVYGYEKLPINPANANGTIKEEETVVIYIYEKKDGSVVVKHVDEAGNEIASTETINGKVNDEYTTSAKTIYGYEVKVVPENATGKIAEENTEVTYVYAKKDGNVIVRYVDTKGNELSTSDTITKKVGDAYTTSAKEIYGYEVITTKPANAEGTVTEETITVTYVYEKKDGSVIVKYVDEAGNEIAATETINGKVNDTYTAESKVVYGYEIKVIPENITGKIAEEQTVVTFVYEKKDGSVIVKYVDEEGNELSESDTINGKVNDEYTTNAKTIYGYEVKVVPENATGKIAEEKTEVTYVYAKKDGSVIVKYVDEEGNEIVDPEIIEGKVGDEYTTEPEDLYGYEVKGTPENATGTIEEEQTVVIYEYVKKDGNVIVKFVDEEGNEIAEPEKIEGKVKDPYQTESKEIYGYKVKDIPENATGTIEEEDTEVIYVYERIEGEVKVVYVDKDGNMIADFETINGYVGDEYTTEAKDICGYRLTKVPENSNGEIVEDKTEVVYIYERITGTVRVEYIDKDGNVITESDIISGFVGDEYEVSRKDIDGYVIYAKDPDNQKGEFIDGEVVVTYIYEKPEMVNTGDLNIYAYILTSILSLAGIFYAIKLIRKEDKENN